MTNWAQISTGLLLYACWDQLSEKTGLWKLPIVSTAFMCSPHLKVPLRLLDVSGDLSHKNITIKNTQKTMSKTLRTGLTIYLSWHTPLKELKIVSKTKLHFYILMSFWKGNFSYSYELKTYTNFLAIYIGKLIWNLARNIFMLF